MSSAFSAQWSAQRFVRPAAQLCGVATLALLAGACGSFQFGKTPSLPGQRSGAEVMQPAAPTPPFSATERERIALAQPWVDAAAYDYELEPGLINAVIWVESRFVERATSPAGAQGMMQLMPPTAKELAQSLGESRARSYDPEFNITAGTLYLRKMLNRYDGDVEKALAAYNAGPGNVDKWTRGGKKLPPRSIEYVRLVLTAKARFEEHHEAILTHTDTMLARADRREPAAPVAEERQYVPEAPRAAAAPPKQREAPTPERKPKATPEPLPKPSAGAARDNTGSAAAKPAPQPRPGPAAKSSRSAAPAARGALPSVLD